ncbi:MAG: hypothetical protein AAFU61_03645 [Pseudomonadota bacterium]
MTCRAILGAVALAASAATAQAVPILEDVGLGVYAGVVGPLQRI